MSEGGGSLGAGEGGGDLTADLSQQLLHEVADLKRSVEQLSQPAQSRGYRPGSFLAGAVTVALVVFIIWHRFRYSLRRMSQRHRQREALRQLSHMDAQELRQILGDINLPSWVNFPDVQRVQWLNTVMVQMWPHVAKYVSDWAEESVPQLLDENKPAWIREIKLSHFSLGPVQPEPLGVKVYSEEESSNDEIIVELDFVWNGQQEVSLVVKPVPKGATHAITRVPVAQQVVDLVSNIVIVKVAMERLTLNGRLRLTLRPLLTKPPLVGSIQLAFTEMPKFSFDLTVFGGDLSVLPGLETWLHGLIKDQVLRPYVLPEKVVIPLQDMDSSDFERPRALLKVEVIEAEHVPRMDILSNSDPYVELSVRGRNKVKTQVIPDTKRPRWQETFNLLVHYPEMQVLQLVLFDYDRYDRNDEIGRVEVPVREMPRGQEVEDWFEVEPPHQETPASQKYHQTGPFGLTIHAGQKVIGTLIRPWDNKLLKPGVKKQKGRKRCRLHLKMVLHEFAPEDVDAAAVASMDPGGPQSPTMQRLPDSVRKTLSGGVLVLRILRVESLVGKPWLLGGWKHAVQVRVLFAGQEKKTLDVKGKKHQFNIDQQLEFVMNGDEVQQQGRQVELEVWDMHWRKVSQGRTVVDFAKIKNSKMWRQTMDLQDVEQGRISLEAQWMPLLAANQRA